MSDRVHVPALPSPSSASALGVRRRLFARGFLRIHPAKSCLQTNHLVLVRYLCLDGHPAREAVHKQRRNGGGRLVLFIKFPVMRPKSDFVISLSIKIRDPVNGLVLVGRSVSP